MSRVLLAPHPERPIHKLACWWRLRLFPNPDGHVYVQQIDIPDDWPAGFEPWSGYIDYFDGRNDWSYPHRVSVGNNWDEMDRKYGGTPHDRPYITFPTKFWLDVLDAFPPNGLHWEQLTTGPRHPEEEK